jgi:hypothetical protein
MRKLALGLLGFSLILSTVGVCLERQSLADDVYQIVIKKQDEKAKNRWSLSDWLETRDKMRLQDLWLAIHSPSPYEFFFGANYQWGSVQTGGFSGSSSTGYTLGFGAYASIFGLVVDAQDVTDNRWFAAFNLRIFGYHVQSTNITLEGGLRSESPTGSPVAFRNAFAGVKLTIYLARYFGLDGNYRHFFDSTPNPAGYLLTGQSWEANAFIDFNVFRVYGGYFSAPEILAGDYNSDTRAGAQFGFKVFF